MKQEKHCREKEFSREFAGELADSISAERGDLEAGG
jgi:hypothetical protein